MRRAARGDRLLRRPSVPTVLLLAVGLLGLAVSFEALAVPVVPTEGTLGLLTALSGTLVVGGVANHVLVTGRDLPLAVTESVAAAAGTTVESLVTGQDLDDRRVYLPGTDDRGSRLVVPATGEEGGAVTAARHAVEGETAAVVVTPTAADLVTRFRERRTDAAATEPAHHLDALCDGLTAVYDLAGGASATVDGRHATVAVRACPLGEPRRIDHLVSSFLGTGLADALDRPVEVTDVRPDDGQRAYSFTVALRWPAGERSQ
ncbi:hypothetical protein ACFQL1_08370 [Halomicroarcula sp. GCM10025709]|uniref:hypothetical protein n=1 Tax=Haloarcula TaxID=2237 RepID=UPI0024C211F1|nr:hypothetical protein [Halomicroarcula sp. YJ-61-S]